MDRMPFDAGNPDLAVVRRAILQRLRAEPNWRQLESHNRQQFDNYIEFSPPRHDSDEVLGLCVYEVVWQLIVEEVLAPGISAATHDLPWIHVTRYGRTVVDEGEYQPHDRDSYLLRLRTRIANPDATVFAYLEESLETFSRGNLVASMVMLGVAAERVFDLICASLAPGVADPKEKAAFSGLLERFAMKPKVDWVHDKLRQVQERRPRPDGFPENATLTVTAVYDLIRSQRNDLGHPQETPPRLSRGDAQANLLIFPRYYETAEGLRAFLARNQV